ncbi:similar to Saccharomyces cerevisiae YLR224W F-box protein and component of SCF ubiquitin ligase complexes involved in ubiquitin-dependent protein catabolism [Maudiozyma saulgeensis]|uniref:Similar to Saccharomyces cerevisiae YLR224W F-box protein and component of SCF ubiquitin ligase complexes involved in ubiquitin-dependent protein catabolism n=1 Tax=Maudiozyma saulgeensis TaxID=1789683 RepID=A0A1X7RB18_9SACH|nr:similar to Saccharomyces cerevisiae YLR224W F-box protein and component of SCF ubiquitin ligase complexes involved in ubiquitin-dependent protein catabolism [Kazachstania saulgeensis]
MPLLLTELPAEILCYILNLTKRDLCGVCKLFMSLYNDTYMHKCLKIFPLGNQAWSVLQQPLKEEIMTLDVHRRHIRRSLYMNLLENPKNDFGQNSSDNVPFGEYIVDSWYLIHSLLFTCPFVSNINLYDNIQEDEPIMHSTLFCLPRQYLIKSPRVPLNMWLSIKDVSYLYPIRNIITNVMATTDIRRNEEFSPLGQLCDWIKEPGVYCIRLGTISVSYMDYQKDNLSHFLSMKIVASLTGGYDWNNLSSINLLGYNFDSYATHLKRPWILFKLDLMYESLFYPAQIPKMNSILSSLEDEIQNDPMTITTTIDKTITHNNSVSEIPPLIRQDFKIPLEILSTYRDDQMDPPIIPSIPDPRVPSIII